MVENVNGNRKVFYEYVIGEGKARKYVGPLLSGVGTFSQEVEKAELLNARFASVFTSKMGLQGIPAPRDKRERLEQGRCTFGGQRSGQGIRQQTGDT